MRPTATNTDLSLDVQEEACVNYIKAKGMEEPWFFRDLPATALVPFHERPQGKRVMEVAREYDNVITQDIFHAFKNEKDFHLVAKSLGDRGVRLHIVQFSGGPINLGTRFGKALIHAMQEMSRAMKQWKAIRAKAGGKRFSEIPFGYREHPQHGTRYGLVIHPEESKTIAMIVRMRRAGLPLDKIAKELTRLGRAKRRTTTPWAANSVLQPLAMYLRIVSGEQRTMTINSQIAGAEADDDDFDFEWRNPSHEEPRR